MIPIGDNAPRYRRPVVVPLLILINAVVFALQVGLQRHEVAMLFDRLGVLPVDFFFKWHAVRADPGLLAEAPVDFLLVAITPLLTYQFLHGGPMHILGNMLFLWVYGDNVEGRLGRWRFLLFYLGCGVVAALAHCWMEPRGRLPVVGASGAIAGVLGAYLLLFPRSRVTLIVPIIVFLAFVELPAWLVLLTWFALQMPQVQGVLGWLDVEGVAWWAHIGGFLAGMAALPLFCLGNPVPDRRRGRKNR